MEVGELEERTQDCFIFKGDKEIAGYKCGYIASDQRKQ